MSVNNSKVDWYQTDAKVVITYMIKGLKHDNVTCEFDKKCVNLKIDSDVTKEEKIFDLANEIIVDGSTFKVTPYKIEIVLKKAMDVRWSLLEGEDPSVNLKQPKGDTNQATDVHHYPSSCKSHHDWDKLEKEAAEIEDDRDPLDKMFKDIYKDASEETRKAMIKSFSESGGTVLSTNWDEVKKGHVDVKPPDGMEYRKYQY